MPGAKGAPAGGKSPDQDIDDRPGGAEVDISGRPGRREEAVNPCRLQLRAHRGQQLVLRKEYPKDGRENADFVDAPMPRELRPCMPGNIEDADAVRQIV